MIVFFVALLPTIVDIRARKPLGGIELAVIVCVIGATVLSACAVTTGHARRLLTSPRAVRIANRGSATIMSSAAVTMVAR